MFVFYREKCWGNSGECMKTRKWGTSPKMMGCLIGEAAVKAGTDRWVAAKDIEGRLHRWGNERGKSPFARGCAVSWPRKASNCLKAARWRIGLPFTAS